MTTVPIAMPKLGYDMEEGTIVRWLKEVGEPVDRGEPIAEIGTDKTTVEMEATTSGVLTQIIHQAGADVAVGEIIAVIDDGV
jgi:pyruvate dehydrogenase E2 component (dihydrolipoamide acetyltransferase)